MQSPCPGDATPRQFIDSDCELVSSQLPKYFVSTPAEITGLFDFAIVAAASLTAFEFASDLWRTISRLKLGTDCGAADAAKISFGQLT